MRAVTSFGQNYCMRCWPILHTSARHITDLRRASVVDLLHLLDYPNDYVPVLTRQTPATAGQSATERVDVVDKGALNARLARSYLVELLDRARII